MKTMKYIFLAVILLGAWGASAQWSINGTHTYTNLGGYVGIGTGSSFTPLENLHVYTPSAAANIAVESSYTGTGSQVIGRYRIRNAGNGDLYYIGLRTTNGVREAIQSCKNGLTGQWLEFAYVGIDTRKYELRGGILDAEFKNSGEVLFTNTGNVLFNNTGAIGIGTGTTAPPSGVKLAVNGKVVCTELEIKQDIWADYVFNENHKLIPLSDVEKFIQTNKHLPGIPSAKEVVQNGLSVGDISCLMMQKIEELTLYMIDLKKENDLLKERIETLEK